MRQGSYTPSMAANILGLCTEVARLHEGEGRELLVVVVWHDDNNSEEDDGEDAETVRADLDMLERSWTRIKTALEKSGPCKVKLKVKCIP